MSVPAQEKKEATLRDSNIELLRMVLMAMIILHHLIVHCIGIGNLWGQPLSESGWLLLLNSFVVMSVNTFLFISGYYGIVPKVRGLLSLLLQAVFYSVVITFVFHLINRVPFNPLFSALPISSSLWWFVTNYVALYFLAPLLNKGVALLNNTQLLFVLAGLFYFNCVAGVFFNTLGINGYTFFSFIFIYTLARSLHKWAKIPSFGLSLGLYLAGCLLLFLLVALAVYKQKILWASQLFYYNNPLVVAMSVFFFFLFKNLSIQNHYINKVSPWVFGIYLLHDHYYVRDFICASFRPWIQNGLGGMILTTALIFSAALVLEGIRASLFAPFIKKTMEQKWLKALEEKLGAK